MKRFMKKAVLVAVYPFKKYVEISTNYYEELLGDNYKYCTWWM
jgi:hypothetical protein